MSSRSTAKILSLGSKRILPHVCRPTPGLSSASFSTASTPLSSSSSSWVTTEHLEEDSRIALLKLHRSPANALSLEFCQELSAALQNLQADGKTSAVVVGSSLPSKIFSAGLDISTELYQPDVDRLPDFWRSFQQVFLDLYGSSRLTTIAALEGPAPAGGCMLALSCDYRIADATRNSKMTIGLNESQLGIVAPPWMCQQYIHVLGHRQAELALMSGQLFPPHQALELGLVDELVDVDANADASAVQLAAIAKAKELVRIPQGARAAVKELTRGPLCQTLIQDRDADVDFFCNFVTSPNVQSAIGKYLEALAAGKASKKPPT